jgi:hypothetical protein
VYLTLGILALVVGCLWWMTRKRIYRFALLGTALLLLVVWFLTLFIVTDRMRIVRTVETMAQAIHQHNLDEFFKHVSPQFGHDAMDAQQFRLYTEAQLRRHKVYSFHVHKITAPDVSRQTGSKAGFWIDVEGAWEGEAPPLRCEATFVFEREEWLLKGFKLLLGNSSTEFRLPPMH